MSILNVWLTSDHALIGTDTVGVSVNGQRGRAGKYVYLPLTNSIFACRGHALFFCWAVSAISWSETFDQAADRLLEVAANSFGVFVDQAPTYGITTDDAKLSQQELVLVGWSVRRQRIACMAAEKAPGPGGFALADCPRHYLTPWDASLTSVPSPDSPPAMHHLAKAQVDLMTRHGYAAGGQLKLAMLRRDGVQCWDGGAL